MRIVIFGPQARVGVIQGDRIVDASYAYSKYLAESESEPYASAMANAVVPPRLLDFIIGGRRTLDAVQTAVEYLDGCDIDEVGPVGDQIVFPFDKVKLHAPFPGRRIACAGSNYAQHSAGMAVARGESLGDSPETAVRERGMWGFWKLPITPVGPGGDVIYPARTERLDYEGEAAIVLGKEGKDLSSNAAETHVWGVTLLIDWSVRDAQELRNSRWALGKNFDTSTSIGPCIVVDEVKPDEIEVKTVVNGELRQHYSSSTMVFSFGEYLELLSRDLTFVPGDIISGGTGAGTAQDTSRNRGGDIVGPDKFLHPGDVVTVSSPQIGELLNNIVAKPVAK